MDKDKAIMTDSLTTTMIPAADGTRLAVHELGDAAGRPVVLVHGFASNAGINWIKYGTAARLAEAGFRCIMPDLRGHGQSEAPVEPAAYPRDILVRDVDGIISTLGLADYDLCGFSLGARAAAKLVIDGARPRRLILSGMGLEGLIDWSSRSAHFLDILDRADTLQRGDPGFLAAAFMRTTGIPTAAARLVLSSFGDLAVGDLDAITIETLILAGDQDRDNGSPDALADALVDARAQEIPGNHMSSVTKPEFGKAISAFLSA